MARALEAEPFGPWAWALGWAALAVVTGARLLWLLDEGDAATRLIVHAYDASHFTLLALASVGWAALAERLARGRVVITIAATAAIALAIGAFTLPADLAGPSHRLAAAGLGGVLPLLVIAVALLVPIGELVGRGLARVRLGAVALLIVAGIGALDDRTLSEVFSVSSRHAGAHLFLAWGQAALVAGATRRWTWPRRRPRRAGELTLALAIIVAAAPIVLPVHARAYALMARFGRCVLFPYWAARHGEAIASYRPEHPPVGPWWAPREGAAEVPPSVPPPLVDGPPLVVLLTIDTVRRDVLDLADAGERFPTLTAMRREGVEFRQARAPSSRTAYTLAAIFAGKTFSQLYWETRDGPAGPTAWPHRDPTERVAARLSRHGVRTASFPAAYWLTGAYGLADGFAEEVAVGTGRVVSPGREVPWSAAAEVVDALVDRVDALAREPAAPTLLYAHFLDPHHPYDQGEPRDDSEWERYLAEIAVVDAQIGRLRRALAEAGLERRAIVIVTADHGESFGEHNTIRHGATLYDEVLRVPLLVVGAGIAPRRVDAAVSLIDLGPTLLDLFGVSTPGATMGQSLAPFLRGEEVALTRPLVFEARPLQGILLPDGTKVIRDLHLGVVEAFDLTRDPDERENLAGADPAAAAGLDPLAHYFWVHELRRPGYAPPDRR